MCGYERLLVTVLSEVRALFVPSERIVKKLLENLLDQEHLAIPFRPSLRIKRNLVVLAKFLHLREFK